MSTDWDVFCLDCREGHGFSDANHQDQLMRDLIANAPALAALGRSLALRPVDLLQVTLCGLYGGVHPEWFAAHEGHRLVPRSEYGDVDGACGKPVRCACGMQRPCVRDRDHRDECSFDLAKVSGAEPDPFDVRPPPSARVPGEPSDVPALRQEVRKLSERVNEIREHQQRAREDDCTDAWHAHNFNEQPCPCCGEKP